MIGGAAGAGAAGRSAPRSSGCSTAASFGKRRRSGAARQRAAPRARPRAAVRASCCARSRRALALDRANLLLAQGERLVPVRRADGAAAAPAARRSSAPSSGTRTTASCSGGTLPGRAQPRRRAALPRRLPLRLPARRARHARRRSGAAGCKRRQMPLQQRGPRADPPPARPGGAGDRERAAPRAAPDPARGGARAPAATPRGSSSPRRPASRCSTREGRVVSANAAFARARRRRPRRAASAAPRRGAAGRAAARRRATGRVEVGFCDAARRASATCSSRVAPFARGRAARCRVLVVHDVSERVAMENALKEKDRLAALGMLAAGVAHEVNTPITGISSYAQMLLAETAERRPALRAAEEGRAPDLPRRAHRQQPARVRAQPRRTRPTPVDAAPAGRRVPRAARATASRKRRHRASSWRRRRPRSVDRDRLRRRAAAGVHQPDPERHRRDGRDRRHARRVDARVADAGGRRSRVARHRSRHPARASWSGSSSLLLDQASRGGTGLGLSISYEIVRRHGGDAARSTSQPGGRAPASRRAARSGRRRSERA